MQSPQGEKALHEAKRSENDRGVPDARSEDDGGVSTSQLTTAWPLALIAICLIIYASLYPFTEWRDALVTPFSERVQAGVDDQANGD